MSTLPESIDRAPQRIDALRPTAKTNLPPGGRSRVAHGLTAAAALGVPLRLQVCVDCGEIQYPPRECCGKCLSPHLQWRDQPGRGALLGVSTLHHSNDAYFRERLPWRIGLVRLDAGPAVIAFLTDSVANPDARVRVSLRMDRSGQAVLIGQPEDEKDMNPNEKLQRETACHPRGRNVLVTDGQTAVGQALVRALHEAGAATVWAGHCQRHQHSLDTAALARLRGVELLELDVTDPRSIAALDARLGGRTDIVISNAETHQAPDRASAGDIDLARAQMEVHYFGLLHLYETLAPALNARAQGAGHPPVAWVNLMSVCALSNDPARRTFSASSAAAMSLAQGLRAQMCSHGVRVLNVFPGPIDDTPSQHLPPPKLNPAALAGAVVNGLVGGVEDLFPGDLAQEWYARWRDNPKALERELAQAGR